MEAAAWSPSERKQQSHGHLPHWEDIVKTLAHVLVVHPLHLPDCELDRD